MWHRLNGPCEPILAGTAAVQSNIIKFNHKLGSFYPVLMIQNNSKGKYRNVFLNIHITSQGLGNSRDKK